jgi:3'-5' exoribonuclease
MTNTHLDFLKFHADRLGVTDLCRPILESEKFPIWSGASKPFQHHYGTGGLCKHVAEVVRLCFLNNDALGKPVDERQLFLAALFHDVGKMWDYESVTKLDEEGNQYTTWQGASHKRHVHHISRSALVWQSCVDHLPATFPKNDYFYLTPQYVDEVLHAILSHHGQREYGSPVAPNTKLAWMVHLCDGISARMDDAEKWDHIKVPT